MTITNEEPNVQKKDKGVELRSYEQYRKAGGTMTRKDYDSLSTREYSDKALTLAVHIVGNEGTWIQFDTAAKCCNLMGIYTEHANHEKLTKLQTEMSALFKNLVQ